MRRVERAAEFYYTLRDHERRARGRLAEGALVAAEHGGTQEQIAAMLTHPREGWSVHHTRVAQIKTDARLARHRRTAAA